MPMLPASAARSGFNLLAAFRTARRTRAFNAKTINRENMRYWTVDQGAITIHVAICMGSSARPNAVATFRQSWNRPSLLASSGQSGATGGKADKQLLCGRLTEATRSATRKRVAKRHPTPERTSAASRVTK